MDTARLCIAGLPFAIYLIWLACLNLSRRPRIFTGTTDTYALGAALIGFMIVGPLDMLLPVEAAARYGPLVWPIALCFYSLCLTLWLLLAPPRLVVYNATLEQTRQLLQQAAEKLDPEHCWAGDSLSMPQLGIQLHLEHFRPLRHVSLVGVGHEQSYFGWRQLRTELKARMKECEVAPNPYGLLMLAIATVLLVYPGTLFAIHHETVADQIRELLRRS